ncbi:MAG TPA: type II toxin-antitoxin system prevent-host-death family antitoxin [Hellea balneolensis]|uniref:Antitoxin n=1 Tax=Hellea balneolensis TaxID=287478 RepID=A0A7V5NW42_9PROT|nr:type II toxin-antitoxin system prevent-host-death family antitoxin [Hellea balneolensis]
MSESIGAFEAKTHLSALLEKVSKGAEFTITRRGKPVARLVPAVEARRTEINRVIERLKEIRTGTSLGGDDWKTLRDTGRR